MQIYTSSLLGGKHQARWVSNAWRGGNSNQQRRPAPPHRRPCEIQRPAERTELWRPCDFFRLGGGGRADGDVLSTGGRGPEKEEAPAAENIATGCSGLAHASSPTPAARPAPSRRAAAQTRTARVTPPSSMLSSRPSAAVAPAPPRRPRKENRRLGSAREEVPAE
jgi:hypothetical protein